MPGQTPLCAGLQIPHMEDVSGRRDCHRAVREKRHISNRGSKLRPLKVFKLAPVSKSHSLSVLFPDAEISRRPFASTARAVTQFMFRLRVRFSTPRSKSQTLRVLSADAETARRPSA